MSDQRPPELFAERPVRSDFGRGPGIPYGVRRAFTVLFVLGIVGGLIYWKFGTMPSVPGEIPTIKGSLAYKQRPDQPGGIDIPHQDVQVYRALDGAGVKPEVEHLLPPPETPQAAAATAPISASTAMAPEQLESIPPVPAPASHIETTVMVPSAVTSVVKAPASAVASAAAVALPTPIPAPAPQVTKPKAAPTMNDVLKSVAVPNKGDTVIQLASLPDQSAAQTSKQKLQTKYASALNGVSLQVVKADLGVKGVYYRIQSQKIGETQAKSICAAIKTSNAGCILVRQ